MVHLIPIRLKQLYY